MKYLFIMRQLFLSCCLLFGILLPAKALAQGVTISGPNEVCIGDVRVYTASISNPAYSYQWTVAPISAGTVLSGNHTGASVQWEVLGAATVQLVIRDPNGGDSLVATGSLAVTVAAMPAPYVTTNVNLGCQPLNDDTSRKGEQRPPKFDEENCHLVCENSTVRYTANGNPGSTYTWSVTGAVSYTPITGPYCDVSWGAPGFGLVTLTETTSSGCVAEITFCVEILQGPTAKFETVPGGLPDPIDLCLDGELVLQDASIADPNSPIVSYLWVWGDGSETPMSPGAAGSPVTHQYTTPGTYEVSLIVMNSCGCVDKYTRRVRVSTARAPKISCPRVVCEGERAVYTIDRPCAPDSWNVIGGTITYVDAARVEVVWDNVDPNTGFGYVTYTSCPPCRTTVVEPVPVILKRGKIQGPVSICVGEQYVYRMPKWPSTEFFWDISGPGFLQPTDQRNEVALTATGVGVIRLTVKYTNTVLKCSGVADLEIIVEDRPVINGPTQLCQGSTENYDIGGLSGNWTLYTSTNTVVTTGSGAVFNHTFSTPGNFRLSVNGSGFCPPDDKFITVVGTPPPPDMITGPDRACTNVPIRFDAGNPIAGTTFEWSVVGGGGGTPDALVGDYSYITFNPTLPASVQVVRITTSGITCRSTAITKLVDVSIPPLSISGSTSVCHSTSEVYTMNFGGGDFYEWFITPATLGSVVANANTDHPTIMWNTPTTPTAVATIKGRIKKCDDADSVTINVTVAGIPSFSVTSISPNDTVCSHTPVTINITPTFPVSSATSYTINWGDVPPITVAGYATSFNHTYMTTGTTAPVVYHPTIAINQPNGCLGSPTISVPPITVMPAPAAVLSPSGPLQHCGTGWSELLTVTETTGIGGSNTFSWTPSISTGTTGTATAYGNYSVTVSNSIFGCSATSNTVQIIQNCGGTGTGCTNPPVVTFTPTVGHCGNISLTASISGSYTGHSWLLPSGVSGSGPATALTATAAAAGNYTVRLRLFYGSGCYVDYVTNVLVPYIPNLRSSISCNQVGGNYTITLFDNSTMYTTITSRNYYKAPSSPIPSTMGGLQAVTTQAPGTTETYFQVIQGGGMAPCTSTVTVTTPAFPSVSIGMTGGLTPGCIEDVAFSFGITGSTGTISNYLWNLVPAINYSTSPSVVYSTPGIKPVSLTVTDIYGCTASAVQNVQVVNNPFKDDGHSISAAPNPVCQGNPVTLTYNPGSGGYPNTSYTWYEQSTALTTTYPTTYSHNVFTPGSYWVLAKSSTGCIAKPFPSVTAIVNQIPAVSISGNAGQCMNQAFTLTTQSYPGYTYSWSGAGTGSGTSITQTLTSPGTYTYFVTITDPLTGCTRTSPGFTVTVNPPPAAPSLSYNIINCNPYEVQLTATGAPGNYTWSNGMSGTVINTPFGGAYQVTLTDLNGCVAQNAFEVPKSPEEYIWIFPTGCFCKPVQGAYLIGPIIPFNFWAWIRNGGIDVSGSGVMPNYPISPGNVYNMLLDNGACSVTSGDMYYQSDTCRRLPASATSGNIPDMGLLDQVADLNQMVVAPNPARIQTTVHYSFAEGSSTRTIEILDITGRTLQVFELKDENGKLQIPMHRFAAGMYQVVMRRDGKMVQQSKLSLTQ